MDRYLCIYTVCLIYACFFVWMHTSLLCESCCLLITSTTYVVIFLLVYNYRNSDCAYRSASLSLALSLSVFPGRPNPAVALAHPETNKQLSTSCWMQGWSRPTQTCLCPSAFVSPSLVSLLRCIYIYMCICRRVYKTTLVCIYISLHTYVHVYTHTYIRWHRVLCSPGISIFVSATDP